MKAALLINRENFEKYSKWEDTGWELIHFGNGVPDVEKVTASKADVLVVDAMLKIVPEIIDNMPGLKLIHSQGVAFNAIDLEVSQNRNVYVCNNAGMNARPVAEQAILLMLALIKSFRRYEDMVYAGKQMDAKTECFANGLSELADYRVGIIGYGAIGRELTSMLKAFGCSVCYHNSSGEKKNADIPYVTLNELYASCDIISVHAPVKPDTINMINDESLKLMKRGAILINTARGELMDHEAVVRALVSGQLGGLGTDVLAPEPVLADNPLLVQLPAELRKRVAISPHIGGITSGSFVRAYERIRKNIEAIDGDRRPECIVNGL